MGSYSYGESKGDIFLHHMHSRTSSFINELVKGSEGCSLDDYVEENFYGGSKPGNHFIDYFSFRKAVDKNINLIFNDTTHRIKEDRSYDEVYKKVKKESGEFRKFEKHVYFEIGGKEAVIINSSEVNVTDKGSNKSHFTVTGLDMGYEDFGDLSLEGLTDLAKEAEITSVAHPYLPVYHTGKELLYSFLEKTNKDEFRAGINYSTGYFKIGNMLSRGEIQKYLPTKKLVGLLGDKILPETIYEQLIVEETVTELAEKYGLPLIPETDGHSLAPERLQGTCILENTVMDELSEGKLPVEKLLDFKVVDYGYGGLTFPGFIRSFPGVMPFWNYREGSEKNLFQKILSPVFNYYPEEFREDFEESLKSLKNTSFEDLAEKSREVN